jgi:hypothetical protein
MTVGIDIMPWRSRPGYRSFENLDLTKEQAEKRNRRLQRLNKKTGKERLPLPCKALLSSKEEE